MASIENYIPVTTGAKKRSILGKIADGVGNYYTGMADAGLGILGMGDIINEKSYRGDNADKWDKGAGIVNKVGQVAGSVALTMATGGAAAPSLGVALGGALLPKSFESGGMRNIVSEDNELIELQGNTHAQGGINIGNGDEAEGGETIFNSRNSGQFVFSEKLKLPNSKKSFADESKKIEKEYKNNKDSLREKAMKKRIGNLAALQESVKPKEKILGNKFNTEGLRGRLNIQNSLNNNPTQLPLPNQLSDVNAPIQPFSLPTNITYPVVKKLSDRKVNRAAKKSEAVNFSLPEEEARVDITDSNIPTMGFDLAKAKLFNYKLNTPKDFTFLKTNRIVSNSQDNLFAKNTSENLNTKSQESTGLKNMSALPQIIGYGAQALANLPGLFTKPERVKYDRVSPDLINLSAEREALTQDRNLSRAISRKAAAGSNNVGQALNFLGASESDLSRQFGQNISKSFQTEANLNSEIKNKAAMFNAEISRAEQDANIAERDAAKGTRLQSLSNIGSITALGVKDWMDTKYKLAQLGALDTGDFVYVFDRWDNPVKKEKKYNADGTWDGKSFKN